MVSPSSAWTTPPTRLPCRCFARWSRRSPRDPGDSVAAVHRVGALDIGDIAVVVAVGRAHRNEAFAACRALIDDLKATVPIWKHQRLRRRLRGVGRHAADGARATRPRTSLNRASD